MNRFPLRCIFSLLLLSVLTLHGQEKQWFFPAMCRIELGDTAGMHSGLETQLNHAGKPEEKLLAELALTNYFNAVNNTSAAERELGQCRRLDSLLQIDSLSGILAALEGNYYFINDNYIIALEFYNTATLHFNNKAVTPLQARSFTQRGIILQSLKNHPDDAEKNFLIALDYYSRAHIPKRKAAVLNNLGITNTQQNDSAKASYYLFRSLAVRDSIHDLAGVGQCYNNLGALMFNFRHYDLALKYYQEGKAYRVKGNAPYSGLIESDINIGKCLKSLGRHDEAIVLLEQSAARADSMHRLELQRRAYFELMGLYFEKKDYKRAYETRSEYDRIQDSLYGESKKDEVAKLAMQYDFMSKLRQDSLQRAVQEAARQNIQAEKDKRINSILVALLAGLALAGLVVYNLYRSNKEKKKSNEIISRQRDTLDKKQREITESIRYAQYIQESILPGKDALQQLGEYFILYQPKDIVSGDFYWMHASGNALLVAAADCTGHGVPGAFMSLLGKENLDKVVAASENPGELLSLLNRAVKQSMRQDRGAEATTRDGMDIALVRLDLQKGMVRYAGANRPLWLIRKNAAEMEELRPVKAAIGGFTADDQRFEEHTLQLQKGDLLYLFTDGFADQFGGEKKKKLTTKKFRELLFSLRSLPPSAQKEKLQQYFLEWKKDLEQVDDILVIGIRV